MIFWAYGRNFLLILEFHAMPTCWPFVLWYQFAAVDCRKIAKDEKLIRMHNYLYYAFIAVHNIQFLFSWLGYYLLNTEI